jgi:hypothetical protein
MFFVLYLKNLGTGDEPRLYYYWLAFESIDEAETMYSALVEDDSVWSATVCGDVIQSTDYAKTGSQRDDR